MLLHFYALGLILLASLPAIMMVQNLPLFRRLAHRDERSEPAEASFVSVLIPARDEELSIAECLRCVLACPSYPWLRLEVIVMDDGSVDSTRAICESFTARDDRVRLLSGQTLPPGWNGKQHACWRLAESAQGDWLLFIDADVRLAQRAIPSLVNAATSQRLDLLSGFPKQITETFMERLLIPLMHFILLGYLPIARMRASTGPEFAAGCGQLFLARRSAYMACEGHKAIAKSRHDGIKLPRVFRQHGSRTDIFDASNMATCRMYHNAGEVIRGLMKNATEGIGSPRTIVPFTILLAGSAVLPVVSLVVGAISGWQSWIIVELVIAVMLSYAPRLLAAYHFEQSWIGAALHPLSVGAFLAIQWLALFAQWCGMQTRWRGRTS